MAVPHKSEIARANAEAEKFLAEAREATAKAEVAELMLGRELEKRVRELTANEHHHVYVFDTEVSEASVKKCVAQLTTWSRQDPRCKMEIQINSPGGSIFDGFALIDFMRDLRMRGHEITAVALGMAASMGGVILQAADKRVIGAHCMMLIHEGSLGAIGNFGEVEDRVKLMELLHDKILALFEERARPINKKTTRKFIETKWQRRDWWLDAHTAVDLGFADEVR